MQLPEGFGDELEEDALTIIQMFLDTHYKTKIQWDNMEYYVYPKHIIEALLKDYKKGPLTKEKTK